MWIHRETDPALANTTRELLQRAAIEEVRLQAFGHGKGYEFNAGADLTMQCDFARMKGHATIPVDQVEHAARYMMLFVAMLNEGLNPGSAFINAALAAGWNYNRTFYKQEPSA